MSTLNFVLSASAAQRIHDVLICLSKFSEYVCLDARCNRFTLSALNSTKSAYGGIALSSDHFFESYKFVPQADSDAEATNLEASQFTCRLYSKALLAAFRQRYFDTKERGTAIERCKVSLGDDPSRPECRLLVQLLCSHGVLKTYKLTYEEVEVMAPVFDRDCAPNRWGVKARLMKDYMEHFGPKAEGLDITSNNGRAVFTSFTEKVTDGKEILKLPMRTNIALDTSDFEDWSAEDKVNVAISLKDMKAIILHAASLSATVSTFYSVAGRPFQLVYEFEGMKCEFTLMTMTQVTDLQTFATITRVEPRPIPRPTPRPTPRPLPHPSASLSRGTLEPEVSQRNSTQGLRELLDEDEGLYRPPTQSFRAQPNVSAQHTQQPETLPPSPSQVLPSQRMTQGLFLPYESEEDSDDDLGKGLDSWDEPRVRWDSGGNDDVMPSISVVRDQIAPGLVTGVGGDETESEGEGGDTVGPTMEVSQARGLFDF